MTFYRLFVYDAEGHATTKEDYLDLDLALDAIMEAVRRSSFSSLQLFECVSRSMFTYTNPAAPIE